MASHIVIPIVGVLVGFTSHVTARVAVHSGLALGSGSREPLTSLGPLGPARIVLLPPFFAALAVSGFWGVLWVAVGVSLSARLAATAPYTTPTGVLLAAFGVLVVGVQTIFVVPVVAITAMIGCFFGFMLVEMEPPSPKED